MAGTTAEAQRLCNPSAFRQRLLVVVGSLGDGYPSLVGTHRLSDHSFGRAAL